MAKRRSSPSEIVQFAKDLELLCKKYSVVDCWLRYKNKRYELSEIHLLDKAFYRNGRFCFMFTNSVESDRRSVTTYPYDWLVPCKTVCHISSNIEALLIAKMLECTFDNNAPSPWTIPQL